MLFSALVHVHGWCLHRDRNSWFNCFSGGDLRIRSGLVEERRAKERDEKWCNYNDDINSLGGLDSPNNKGKAPNNITILSLMTFVAFVKILHFLPMAFVKL